MSAAIKRSAVLYHYPCPDGAFAALSAHLYFSAVALPVVFFPNTVYNPLRVANLPLHELDDVYLLDFVGPPGFVNDIASRVGSVVVLDHHKTALEMLRESTFGVRNVTKVIDMDRSGAMIAFDFFNEQVSREASSGNGGSSEQKSKPCLIPEWRSETVIRLFKFIEDGDLWRWELPNSKAFSSGLKDLGLEYNINLNSSLFEQLLSLDPDQVILRGNETLLREEKLIKNVLQNSYEIALGGGRFGRCLAVDGGSLSNLRSELGNELAIKSRQLKLRGIGTVVYRVPELDNILKVSLRSLDSEDTTPISEAYNGGGHRSASSFMLNCAEFECWKMEI